MRKLLFALLCSLAFSANAFDMLAGGTRIPAAARAAGYTLNTFSINSNFNTTTVDNGATYASGYKMYRSNYFGGVSAPAGTLNADGSVTISGSQYDLVSAGKITTAPYFVGIAFGGGGYFEAELKFDPATAYLLGNWPAFWLMSIEHNDGQDVQWSGEVAGYRHFMEVDIMEAFSTSASDTYQSTLHDWYGVHAVTCSAWCSVTSNYYAGTAHAPKGTDWNIYHRYAVAWIPATVSTQGCYYFYFDDIKMSSICYSQFTTQAAPPTSLTPWTFGIGDSQHLTLEFGGGPITVKSVNVWQATTSNNWTN